MANSRFSGRSIADAMNDLQKTQQATLAAVEDLDRQEKGTTVGVAPTPQERTVAPLPPAADAAATPQEHTVAPLPLDEGAAQAVPEHAAATLSSTGVERAQSKAAVKSAAKVIDIRVVVEELFSKEVKYKNSRNSVAISEEYRGFIGFISELSKCEVSQIVNNMLSLYFNNPEIADRLTVFAKNKCKARMDILMKR